MYREDDELRVGVTWFNRKSDIPAKEARRAKLAGDGPRQVGAGAVGPGAVGQCLVACTLHCPTRPHTAPLCLGLAAKLLLPTPPHPHPTTPPPPPPK